MHAHHTRETEIAALVARYGEPLRISADLPDTSVSPLSKTDRIGEVCMVVRRPNGLLLTARKVYYPPGITRLLTGGIGHTEAIETALLRETDEETSLTVQPHRFLAIVSYSPPAGAPPLTFTSYAFLLDETGGTLHARDEEEEIEAFHEVMPGDLPALATALEQAPETYCERIEGNWRAWGVFRAAAHRAVFDALARLV